MRTALTILACLIVIGVAIWSIIRWWQSDNHIDEEGVSKPSWWLVLPWLPVVLTTALLLYPFFIEHDNNGWMGVYNDHFGWLVWPRWWFWLFVLLAVILLKRGKLRWAWILGGLLWLAVVISTFTLVLTKGFSDGEDPLVEISISHDDDKQLPIPFKADLGQLNDGLNIDNELRNDADLRSEGMRADWDVFPQGTKPAEALELVGTLDSDGLDWAMPVNSVGGPGTYTVYLFIWHEGSGGLIVPGKDEIVAAGGPVEVVVDEVSAEAAAPAAGVTPPAELCASFNSWLMVDPATVTTTDWEPGGVPSLGTAQSDAELRAALVDEIEAIKDTPAALAEFTKRHLHRSIDPATYRLENGCASAGAIQDFQRLIEAVNDPEQTTVLAADPSNSSTTTGIVNGDVTSNDEPGLNGDGAGMTVIPEGEEAYGLEAGCGNMTHLEVPADLPVQDIGYEEETQTEEATETTAAATTSQAPRSSPTSAPSSSAAPTRSSTSSHSSAAPSSSSPAASSSSSTGAKDCTKSPTPCTTSTTTSSAPAPAPVPPAPVPEPVESDPVQVQDPDPIGADQPPGAGGGCTDLSGNSGC